MFEREHTRAMPRPRRPRIDWTAAARLMAEGVPAEEVAGRLGGTVDQIRRNLRRSRRFRDRIDSERRTVAAEAALSLGALRGLVAGGLADAAACGNVRVLLWLAEHLGLDDTPLSPPLSPEEAAEERAEAERRRNDAMIRRLLADAPPELEVQPDD